MSAWIIPPIAGFIDNGTAPEFYIDGIGGLELAHGNIRAYLVAEQLALESGRPPHRLVTAKIVGPVLNIPIIIGQLAQCLWQPTREAPPGPRLVR